MRSSSQLRSLVRCDDHRRRCRTFAAVATVQVKSCALWLGGLLVALRPPHSVQSVSWHLDRVEAVRVSWLHPPDCVELRTSTLLGKLVLLRAVS